MHVFVVTETLKYRKGQSYPQRGLGSAGLEPGPMPYWSLSTSLSNTANPSKTEKSGLRALDRTLSTSEKMG